MPQRDCKCRAVLPLSLLDDAPRNCLAHRHGRTETKGLKGVKRLSSWSQYPVATRTPPPDSVISRDARWYPLLNLARSPGNSIHCSLIGRLLGRGPCMASLPPPESSDLGSRSHPILCNYRGAALRTLRTENQPNVRMETSWVGLGLGETIASSLLHPQNSSLTAPRCAHFKRLFCIKEQLSQQEGFQNPNPMYDLTASVLLTSASQRTTETPSKQVVQTSEVILLDFI